MMTAHYPSWGSGSTTPLEWVRHLDRSSLPLMGIGIRRRHGCGRSRIVPHYPSWGSGSPRPAAHRRDGAGAHYPSWGSGSPARPPPGPGTARRLTTPHGDRDRPGRHRTMGTSLPGSLPLMGIGITWDHASNGDQRWLTTPHGDRDLRRDGARSNRHPALTTPHGDRDLRASHDSTRRTHGFSLPLMGIGIRRSCGGHVPRKRISLPLMGIGIIGATEASSTDSTSLPLMGIGIAHGTLGMPGAS